MSIPKKRSFNCTRGFQAATDVGFNSPKTENNQSVNIVVTPNLLTKDKALNYREVKLPTDFVKEENKVLEPVDPISTSPLTDDLEKTPSENFISRDINSAKENLEEFEALIKSKDNLIEALSLILDMYENNPLIVNKYIIPNEEELTRLIFLLTSADAIELVKTDPDTGCSCKVSKFTYISKIMVKKNDNIYNFKYSYPNAIQLLDNRRISWKIVV